MIKIKGITTELLRESFRSAIRSRVGPGLDLERDDLHRITGIDERTLDSYRNGENLPTLPKFFQIVASLETDFLNSLLNIIGIGGAHRLDPEEANPFIVFSNMAEESRVLAKCLEDGRLDHTERAELSKRLLKHGNNLIHYAKALGAD